MSTFEEALRASVQGVDQGFRRAESDLREETAIASEAVLALTAQQAWLELVKFVERPTDTSFDLRLRFSKTYFQVGGFLLNSKGYPIRAGRTVELIASGEFEAVLRNREELHTYFIGIASNPDSPLVLRMVLLTRDPKNENR
jgi:hypothetical protein